jgi:hypothetical protein
MLDDFLAQKQRDGLKHLVELDRGVPESRKKGRVKQFQDGEQVTTMKHLLRSLRQEMQRERQKRSKDKVKRYGIVIYLVGAIALSLIVSWIGLGCYGLYVVTRPTGNISDLLSGPFARGLVGRSSSQSGDQEIVIRVVREVVHVDKDGGILGKSSDPTILSSKGIDAVTECVIKAL